MSMSDGSPLQRTQEAPRPLQFIISTLDVRFMFAYAIGIMGHMKRQEAREAAAELEKETIFLGSKTLGHLCAAQVLTLKVSCQNCTRNGRYRVTRMIDRHGAGMTLIDLKSVLVGDCRNRNASSLNHRCAVVYPGLSRHVVSRL